MNTLKKIYSFITDRPYLQTLLVFSFFVIVFQWMYLSVEPLLSGDDHFFHFRFAQIMTEQGFFAAFDNFRNIYFSPLATGSYYPTYNFIFYLVILPLTFIQPLYLAIKIYAILAGAVAFSSFYALCRWSGVRWCFFWTVHVVGFIGTRSFWHLFTSRPSVLAPLMLIGLI